MRRRWAAVAITWLALTPALRLAWLSRDGPHLGFYHDDGLYWVTAKSIAEGGGYRIPSLPGEPHQTKYPPMFPGLLSLAWRLNPEFPANLGTALWITWLPAPILVVLSNLLLARLGVDPTARTLVSATVALSPYVAFLGTTLLAEPWAAVFVLASLIFAAGDKRHACLSGLLAAAAYLAKTMCAPLLAAVFLALKTKRERLGFLACALPPVAAWHWWAAAHRAPAPDITWLYYLDYLGFYRADVTWTALPTIVYRNLGEIFTSGGELLLFRAGAVPGGEYLARLIMLAALAGVIRWARASRRLEYPLFGAGTLLLLLVWDFPANERFFLPLLPLLAMGLWTEMSHVFRLATASRKGAGMTIGAVLVCLGAAMAARNFHATWSDLPQAAGLSRAANAQRQPLYAWIRANTPPDATFFADRDATFYLYTGRRATAVRAPVRYFYTEDRGAILAEKGRLTEFVRARRLDYLLLTPSDFELDALPGDERRAAREAVALDPGCRQVYDSPAGAVVKVDHDAR